MAHTRYLALFVVVFSTALQGVQAQEHTQIDLPAHDVVLLKFKVFDPNHVRIDEQAVLQELVKAMEKQSKWPLTRQNGIVNHVSGLRTTLDAPASRIGFEYVSLDRYSSGSEYGQALQIPVLYQTAHTDQEFAVRLSTSRTSDLVTQSSHAIFRVRTPKLNPAEELLRDFFSILDTAPHLAVDRQCVVKGDKTSQYKPEAVIGNFERLLGRYGNSAAQTTGIDRVDVFAYRVGQLNLPLRIVAVPYRDGAKVMYEASLPYTLRADATGEGYELPDKLSADVDRILAD
jgi:hypothetical protein